ncbi:hypothetical protein BY996DRAFT_769152 [Phakopsora pachyrhizi]|nr:hypothetical protein BY996DRAFT_769152 [Phakopsora pachyrhizi]
MEPRIQPTKPGAQIKSVNGLKIRGLSKLELKRKGKSKYLALIADNYYGLRDKAYDTWDENSLRSWLEKHGVIKTPAQAKRDDLIKVIKDNYYGAQEKVWDTWSDAEMRAYLVKNNLGKSQELASLKRHQLEEKLENGYKSTKDAINQGWDDSEMRQLTLGHLRPIRKKKSTTYVSCLAKNTQKLLLAPTIISLGRTIALEAGFVQMG